MTVKKKKTQATEPAHTSKPKPTTKPNPTVRPEQTAQPQPTISVSNESDVESLEKLIRIQKERGATVNENLKASSVYKWKNNKLIKLDWEKCGLSGELDLTDFDVLEEVDCASNDLTGINVKNNIKLTKLRCCNNQLTGLDVSNNSSLIELSCYSNQLTVLDVTKNNALSDLSCFSNKLNENLRLSHIFSGTINNSLIIYYYTLININ